MRIEVLEPALVRFITDGWHTAGDRKTAIPARTSRGRSPDERRSGHLTGGRHGLVHAIATADPARRISTSPREDASDKRLSAMRAVFEGHREKP